MSRALILMYHAIDEPRSPAEARYCVTPGAFRAQMAELVQLRYRPTSLLALVAALREGAPILPGTVVITFDDGFECFQRNALPVLSQFGIPATLFAVAGKLGESNTWMQSKGWPERRLLSADQLREMQAAGVTIGCHGLSHVPMNQCSVDELTAETSVARRLLCEALGSDVTLFAYPHGAQGERERQAVAAAGFLAACSTEPGFNPPDSDRFALRRIDVYGGDSLTAFRRKVLFGSNHISYGDLARYYVKRIYSRFHG